MIVIPGKDDFEYEMTHKKFVYVNYINIPDCKKYLFGVIYNRDIKKGDILLYFDNYNNIYDAYAASDSFNVTNDIATSMIKSMDEIRIICCKKEDLTIYDITGKNEPDILMVGDMLFGACYMGNLPVKREN